MYKNIIFDFDGVIVDSVDIKTDAFVLLYEKYGKRISDRVKDYHLKNNGISRFEKFKYFEEILLKKKIDSERISVLSENFSKLVLDMVINSNYIPGALNFIKNNINLNQFICTGTPQDEIDVIVEKRNIKKYFNGVYGSPKNKIELIKNIISDFEINISETVFFGDSISDYIAAKSYNMDFIGITIDKSLFPNHINIYKDFLKVNFD
tara:strand:- start:311 stop:931 length:621 start_codon:yes stop_codon:yes gene_type:complete